MDTESSEVRPTEPSDNPKVSTFPQPTRPGGGSFYRASSFARFANGFGGMRFPLMGNPPEKEEEEEGQGLMDSLAKGIVDSSRSAVRAVRHVVSQNKRRYLEGGFDLDMTYITDNIIAMGFPAGDLSSGLFGFFEGLYRNHMEEVISFFETRHKGKYKVYNLCSERLYDASRFEGKVACFPFDDHNCPPLQLIMSFCQSACSWLKEDIHNVVVVHCKAGMGRTGVMICSLLLFLKFFPTAKEASDYFNQKRCVDGKALVLPSQIRYVEYFERVLTYFNGEHQPGRRCMLRGFRLHNCPYWIRPSITISDHNGILFSTRKHPKTKNLMPEDFWMRTPRKNVVVFALPGQPGITELVGDFKIHFQDHHGDFYCWLNTAMTENRKILHASDLDGFGKRKLPSPGFQLEIVMIDYDGTRPMRHPSSKASDASSTSGNDPHSGGRAAATPHQKKASENDDDVFSDSEEEDTKPSKSRQGQDASSHHSSDTLGEQARAVSHATEQLSLRSQEPLDGNALKDSTNHAVPKADSGLEAHNLDTMGASDIKAIAADASVFSFGDEEDYESD